MADLDDLDLDIQFLTSVEFDEDWVNILKTEKVQNTSFGETGCVDLVHEHFTTNEAANSTSLVIGTQIVRCPSFVVQDSEYLANMAEVFENSEGLPVPEIVKIDDIKQIIIFSQILNKSESCDFELEMELRNIELELRIDLLVVSDLLGFNKLKPFILKSVKKSVDSTNWKLVYSRCSTIMGLSSILDHLLNFLLHHTANKQQHESLGNWTELVTSLFMERYLKQNVFEIPEEINFELVIDWASCNPDLEEDIFSLLSLIRFKIFRDVKEIQQAESDICQIGILSSENLHKISKKLKEAIEFKKTAWDFSTTPQLSGENVRLLNNTKNENQWPKLLGCASTVPDHPRSNKLLLLNDQFQSFPNFEIITMITLIRALSYSSNLHYRSSVFYIFYPKIFYPMPQLCQFNLDFKNCFHVLDLPPELKSINDRHRNRKNLVMICNVKNYLYLFSKDAFSKKNFDSVDKLKVYRIDLDLAIESCNQTLALENALLLKWEHFSDIPEIYLESGDNNFDYDVKAVEVGEDIFIVSNELCISLNVSTKVWSEKELAPPARNNPIVFGSDSALFVMGGTCMGQALVSGQKYNIETWEMELLPNIPDYILPDQDLKHYKGLHFKNSIYLYYSVHDWNVSAPFIVSGEKPVLILDLFLNQWTSKLFPYYSLYCLDRPIWL
eukprot:GFUD01019121.1.p1 GENE.GFUD01019121.1~~GFUD01019121.1.p1  ORF type:complete len:669 (+),score=125.27 GFUD01019121.1:38-2044(+)